MTVSIYVGHLLNPGADITEGVQLEIRHGRIASILTGRTPSREDIEFPSAVCVPALINAHDHLKYTWPELIGTPPYADSQEWLPTLYDEAQKRFLECLSLEDLYWLGTYKAIFSGVTTVANHCRRLQPKFFSSYPIRILHDYAREIFVRFDHRSHQMGAGPREEAELARQWGLPFVVHLAEGLNHGTETELRLLEELGGLFDSSVLIHAINISAEDIERIATVGASVVWCPASNRFLFNKTAPIQDLLRKQVNVALGTDSTCTGSETLLSEMRVGMNELLASMSPASAVQAIFSFVTVNAARAFNKSTVLGELKTGAYADLLIFETDRSNPVLGLVELEPQAISLLTTGGRWLVGEAASTSKLRCAAPLYTEILVNGSPRKIAGDPVGLVERVAKKCDREAEFFPLGRIIDRI